MLAEYPHCRWCGVRLDEQTATIDHRTAKAKGGLDRMENYVLSCKPCNNAKGNMSPAEFHRKLASGAIRILDSRGQQEPSGRAKS